MDRLEVQAREAVRGLGRRGRTQRIPAAVRERVVAYAERARAQGRSWRRIAKSVGLSAAGVQRFVNAKPPARRAALVRVAVRPQASEASSAAPRLVWVTPSGHRLERLSLQDAVALLRALG
jgi:hypothetical protein